MELSISVLTIIGSVSAVIISVFSLFMSRRQIIANSITLSRMEEIKELRGFIAEFIAEYLKEGVDNEYDKKVAKARIELYLRRNYEASKGLKDALEVCCKIPFDPSDETNYEILIEEAEYALHWKWMRMKRETGVSTKSETKRKEKLKKYLDGIYDK